MCRSDSSVSRSVVIDDRTAVLILFRPLKDLSAEQLAVACTVGGLSTPLSSRPLNSGPGIYCWRVGGQLIYYLPYFISLNVKTVIVIKNRKKKKERLPLCI